LVGAQGLEQSQLLYAISSTDKNMRQT
jgi:hypothetical protein